MDIEYILGMYKNAEIELYKTGTKDHYGAIVKNVDLMFTESIKVLSRTKCSREYITMATFREAHYFRISERKVITSDGITITPAPELDGIWYNCPKKNVLCCRGG